LGGADRGDVTGGTATEDDQVVSNRIHNERKNGGIEVESCRVTGPAFIMTPRRFCRNNEPDDRTLSTRTPDPIDAKSSIHLTGET